MKISGYSSVKTNGLVALGVLFVFLNFGSFAEARPDKKGILVDGVDLSNEQVTLLFEKDHKKHAYLVDMQTVVTVQGNTGTINDIIAGQRVVKYVERDSASLDSIELAANEESPAGKTTTHVVAATKPSSSGNTTSSSETTTSDFGSPTTTTNSNSSQPPPSAPPSAPSDDTNSPFGTPDPVPSVNPSRDPPPADTRILVDRVDIPNQQVTLVYEKDHTKHVYIIDPATVVTVEDNTGTINDIIAGQVVASHVDRDSKTLASIKVVSP